MTPEEAVKAVEAAKSAPVLLGDPPDAKYKELKVLLHPDRFGPNAKWAKRAEAAIFRLDTLFATVSKNGTPKAPVKIGKWIVTDALAKGDIADLHCVESKDGKGVLKIAQQARDNDLIVNESKHLALLHGPADKASRHMQQYLPKLLDHFNASGRAANVLTQADGYLPLRDMQDIADLDFRHVVWMMNRALSVLGYVHSVGIVHGAVLPEHLLYAPLSHNLCLVDWCYSTAGKLTAIITRHRDKYPPEVLRKKPVTGATDLYMLAKTLGAIATVPKRFRPLFELCTIASPASRPQDAWAFQDRWKKTAEEEYGMPKFVPLVLPVQ